VLLVNRIWTDVELTSSYSSHAVLRVEAVLRRGKRSGLYSSRQTASEIIESADDKLFDQVIRGNHHVLHQLLTDRVDISYNLRSRAHSRALPAKKGHLADKNFIVRMLYKYSY